MLDHNPALVDFTDNDYSTPLILAAGAGHLEAVKTLLEHGAWPSARISQNATALSLAHSRNFPEVAKWLEKPTAKSERDSGFIQIVYNRRIPDIQEALKDGYNINATGKEGRSALLVAMDSKDANRLEIEKLLVANGANVNQPSHDGTVPLLYCLARGEDTLPDEVAMFIRAGADVNIKDHAPLRLAYSLMGAGLREKVIKQLREAGAE